MLQSKLSLLILIAIGSSLLHSCTDDFTPGTFNLEGTVQKGPFIEGTSVTVYELNNSLAQTGRSYETTTDNTGKFSLSGVELNSPYVRLKANGYYYNEKAGMISRSQLTLYCIANVEDADRVNINILSHLEFERVLYLVSEGEKFAKAKEQALNELLAILSVDEEGFQGPEAMDISASGTENAILLAASVIFQNTSSTGDFTEFINQFATDFKEDGVIDDNSIGYELIKSVNQADLQQIRKNLEDRYSDLGVDFNIPGFESYVNNFLENSDFVNGICIGCESDTISDIDGNVYKTIKIGEQYWMAENLKTHHYSNGEEIPYYADSISIFEANTGGYAYIQYDASNAAQYGALYNWYAVVDSRNVCPAGWRVPTLNDFDLLGDVLGGNEIAGSKLKSTTDDWIWGNEDATNESGFNALPAGSTGTSFPGMSAHFWTTDEINSGSAKGKNLYYYRTDFYTYTEQKNMGLSVRCIKETESSK